jgi:alpha-beta hydrolase superfamily lysophospholipase
MTTPARSYHNEQYWQAYQAFFPAHLAIHAEDVIDEEVFLWRDTPVHLDRFKVKNAHAVVILIHGAGGYGRLFAPIGKLLQSLGYEVVAPDLPGYGLTTAPDRYINYAVWTDLLTDLIAHEHHRTQRPVILFGGSIGGFLAYQCAAQSPHVAGLVATTLADPRLPEVRHELAKHPILYRVGLPLLKLTQRFTGNWRLPIRWLTHMNRMSAQPGLTSLVIHDKLGGASRVPLRFLLSLLTPKPAIEAAQFTQCPVLLVHPAADTWTTVATSLLFYDKLTVNKRYVLLDNCGHFPVESPGLEQLEEALTSFLQDIVSNNSNASITSTAQVQSQ